MRYRHYHNMPLLLSTLIDIDPIDELTKDKVENNFVSLFLFIFYLLFIIIN